MSDHNMVDLDEATRQNDFGKTDDGSYIDADSGREELFEQDGFSEAQDLYDSGSSLSESGKDLFDGDLSMENLQGAWQDIQGIKSDVESLPDALSAIMGNPVEWVVSAGLDVLLTMVKPLEDLVGSIAGNEARMMTASQMWTETGQALLPIADHIDSTRDQTLPIWVGEDGLKAAGRMTQYSMAARAMALGCDCIAALLDCAADVAAKAFEEAKKILADLITPLIAKWIAALAASFVTFGGAIAVAVKTTMIWVKMGMIRVANLIKKATAIFEKMVTVVNFVTAVMDRLKPLISVVKGLGSAASDVASHIPKGLPGRVSAEGLGDMASSGRDAIAGAGKALYDHREDIYDQGKWLYDNGRDVYDQGRQVYDDGRELYDRGRDTYESGRQLYETGQNIGETARGTYDSYHAWRDGDISAWEAAGQVGRHSVDMEDHLGGVGDQARQFNRDAEGLIDAGGAATDSGRDFEQSGQQFGDSSGEFYDNSEEAYREFRDRGRS